MTALDEIKIGGLGASRRRVEDNRFIRGKGNYVDDIVLPGMLHMELLRSPVAHARIRSIDTSKAWAIPGVRLVNDSFFNEFTLELPVEARPAVHAMVEKGVLGGVSLGRLYPDEAGLANGLVVAVTETVTEEDVETFASALEEVLA